MQSFEKISGMAGSERGKRRFQRWAAVCPRRTSTYEYAISTLLPALQEAGFKWVDKCFDIGRLPGNTVSIERERTAGEVDYVLLIFDKRFRPRFQVAFGTKEKQFPHRWIRSGSLVWKKKDESVKFKWWGARWWSLNKDAAMRRAINSAEPLLEQVLVFLAGGEAGNHIWVSG